MKLLVLGGTVFLGRHIVEAAREHGHEVTLFNRGRSGKDLFPDAENLVGDRRGDLEALRGRAWDAAIDTSGYLPQLVGASAELLRDQADRYTFISSVSVYQDCGRRDQDEAAPVAHPPATEVPVMTPETYGPLKAACEKVVREVFPGRSLIIRPGLIAGPCDHTDRFTYWPARIARGGEVLAPGNPRRKVQVIDVRDLARWIVAMSLSGREGTFNACGPALSMRQILEACREETGSDAGLTWVDESFLLKHQVTPYTELPLWIPGTDDSFDADSARANGLACSPLRKTIRDTLAWYYAQPGGRKLRNGLDADRESRLLREWRLERSQTASLVE